MKPQLFTVHWILFTGLLAAAALHGQAPKLINYQGKLVRNGQPANGPVMLVFAIYAGKDGGNPLWIQEKNVTVQNGLFNVQLGDETADFDTLFTGKGQRWLEVNEKDKPRLGQRTQITSVAYALKASSANALDAADGGPPNAVFVDNNGNVGIGTTNPNTVFDVIGNAISLTRTGDAPLIRINRNDASGTALLSLARQGTDRWALRLSNDANNNLELADVTSTRLSINTMTGNVGIGTTNPLSPLHIAAEGSATAPSLNIGNQGGNGIYDAGNNTLGIATNGAERMRIEVGGNVGIGTINAQAKLDVWGSIAFFSNASIYRDGALNGLVFNTPGISGNPKMIIRDNGNVGIGTTTPSAALEVGGCVVAQNVSCPSSRRWKTNIQPINGALEKVQRLRGVSYVWKEDGKQNIGLIAEEVAEVIPEVVSFEDNGKDARAIDYSRLVAVLIEAVKEQQSKIADLEGRLKAVEAMPK